jgi:prepilin-type N-terminal cleavage/methylation domain-containing protein
VVKSRKYKNFLRKGLKVMKKDAEKKGFTLIELLVVISIIAILMAIMMPALNKARDLAKNVICKSNLKNMGLASLLWSEDNDGWSLPGLWDRGYDGDSLLKSYMGDVESGSGVGLCPAVPASYEGSTYGDLGFSESDLSGVAVKTGNFYSSYGYNQTLFNSTSRPLGTYDTANETGNKPGTGDQWGKGGIWYKKHGNTKINTIPNPSEKVMFAESYLYLSSPWVYNNPVSNPKFKEQPSRGRRHFVKKRPVPGISESEMAGRMNVAWIDGTVSEEPEDMEKIKDSGRGYEMDSKYWYGPKRD